MLTSDLVLARKKKDELVLVPLRDRDRACEWAESILAAVAAHVGQRRDELDEALAAIETPAHDARVKSGLVKLALDRCTFDAATPLDPPLLRAQVFARAAELRKAGRLSRDEVLNEAARANGVTPDVIDAALYADLRGAHRLVSFDPLSARALVAAYERGQAQAVLLRAVKVVVDVRANPASARALFRRMKFLRLLHTIERNKDRYRIAIDGPFSMFEAVTKYGLELALLLPALDACEAWSLEAEVRWGKERTPLVFRTSKDDAQRDPAALDACPAAMPDAIAALVRAFRALDTRWRVDEARAVLDVRGFGLCVPDLTFSTDGAVVHFEVMGYWSRDAVWRRVELVQAGLREHVLFAVNERLRVSEEVLDENATSALYVYKGQMSARAVHERIERFANLGP